MSDIIDMANDRAALDLAMALKNHQRHDPPLPSVGQCYNCLAPLAAGLRFCDADCMTDYSDRKKAEARR